MEAGFYETDITPLVGMERPGGFERAYIEHIEDRLKVRAAVISDGENRVALVGVDTAALNYDDTVKNIRDSIEKKTGIPGSHVLMAASHSHSAGPYISFFPPVENAPGLVKELVRDSFPSANLLYQEWVNAKIVTAVCEADRRREKAVMCAGVGKEGRFVFNRRLRMKNGRVYTHPGKCNPDILEPAGPVDPDVGVIGVWSIDEKRFLGAVVNYACHGTVMAGAGASADWIFYLDKTIRSFMGQDSTVVFLNGACGDVTQVDNQSMVAREYGHWFARRLGTSVGAEALKVLVSSPTGELAPVKAMSKEFQLKRKVPGKEQIEEAIKIVEKGLDELKSGKKTKKDVCTCEWLYARGLVLFDWLVREYPYVNTEVQAIQVGPAVFLANPAEYFCRLGLEIKKSSPFPFTFIVELANGLIGYVPDREAFLPSGGGYETGMSSTSALEAGAGEKIAEASLSLAHKFKPGSIPEKEKQSSIGSPWDFGMLGPDAGVEENGR
ncbi:MAG TPA: hypothetical protein PKN36_07110 [bacterium]|nr:hypothetical protein [bacterium]